MSTRIYSLLSCLLLISILIGVPFSGHASPSFCENTFKSFLDPQQIMKDAFFDKSIFHPGGCAGNVGRLLQLLSPAQDISQAQVMLLLHEKGYSSGIPMKLKLTPVNVREDVSFWNYHTVVLSKNQIIDLHSKPVPLPTQEYFNRHFPENSSGKRWKNLMLRLFPAEEYLKNFVHLREKNSAGIDQAIAVIYLNKPISPESPLISVADLLLQQQPLQP